MSSRHQPRWNQPQPQSEKKGGCFTYVVTFGAIIVALISLVGTLGSKLLDNPNVLPQDVVVAPTATPEGFNPGSDGLNPLRTGAYMGDDLPVIYDQQVLDSYREYGLELIGTHFYLAGTDMTTVGNVINGEKFSYISIYAYKFNPHDGDPASVGCGLAVVYPGFDGFRPTTVETLGGQWYVIYSSYFHGLGDKASIINYGKALYRHIQTNPICKYLDSQGF